jgi:hydroxymethylpyrimidine pyrophosphatase-like HAD family hydrolase
MGNAIDELKEKAEYITDDCNQNGIYNALKHYHII